MGIFRLYSIQTPSLCSSKTTITLAYHKYTLASPQQTTQDSPTYLCLCFGFLLQIIYTYFPPFRLTLLHPSHSFFTELRTFMPRICCRATARIVPPLFSSCRFRMAAVRESVGLLRVTVVVLIARVWVWLGLGRVVKSDVLGLGIRGRRVVV